VAALPEDLQNNSMRSGIIICGVAAATFGGVSDDDDGVRMKKE
jgi:hypothetical protein